MDLKTPLYETHVREGGSIVPFAGYLLPVQYPDGILAEHEAVRTACGLFDVSHMGELLLSGPGSLASVNHLISSDCTSLRPGRMRYGVLMNERGGCVDDLIVHCLGPDEYLLVVNAANRAKDLAHVRANVLANTEVRDLSDDVCQLALQGPLSREVMADVADVSQLPGRYYSFCRHVRLAGVDCLVSRSGYTGELGYEIYAEACQASRLWEALRVAGSDRGLVPCGLGARDTLRLEAGMPLYGHEIDEDVSPLEAGLSFAVKLDKEEFIGREALIAAGTPARERVGLRVTGRGIAREGQDVFLGDRRIGRTTSGTFAPHLRQAVAMALVRRGVVRPGDAVEVDVRGRRLACEVVTLPFYRRD
ncbi:glycine cleavage system aminomethyltransferase GcvT [Olsenella massiliensis]|uniref:glycine cleavage system aminomethyltransferase GcvT n=1 Tax=Olsenella massiliensis TaxID=1622075 RepID=UPI00071DB708|nr:glycine cleavage system aminomethyltransferase GcvT [Olsenella massiliensis]